MDLAVTEVGSGDALVVFVHGVLGHGRSFDRVAAELDSECRMLWYDRRGYSGSAGAAGAPVTIDGHITDLLDVIDGRRAVVVGHSFGGVTAMGAAVRAPQSVAALVLYETSVGVGTRVGRRRDARGAGQRRSRSGRAPRHVGRPLRHPERRRAGPPAHRRHRVHHRGSLGAHRHAAVRGGRHPGAARLRTERRAGRCRTSSTSSAARCRRWKSSRFPAPATMPTAPRPMPSPASCGGASRWRAHDRCARRSPGRPCAEPARPRLAPRVGRLGLRALQVALAEDHPDWTVTRLAAAADVPVGQARTVLGELERSGLARSVGTGTNQRRVIDDRSRRPRLGARHRAITPEPTGRPPRACRRGITRALLHRCAELAESRTSPLRGHRRRGRAPAFDGEERATEHAADPRLRSRGRDRAPSPPGTSRRHRR